MLPEGYPPLEAYREVARMPRFKEMRGFADAFVRGNEDVLDDYAGKWSRDPLHRWSRRWEYLYVAEHVSAEAERRSASMRILDAGSGLTFFPHWLAHEHPGVEVECPDRDPQIEAAAPALRAPAQEHVSYSTQDLASLSYRDESFGLISCVSVLEHTRNRDAIIGEFARILKPGGVLVLTFDVSPDGQWEISRAEAAEMLRELRERFTPEADYRALLADFDPGTMLTTDWAREHDPTLLPWKYPHPTDMLRRFPNVLTMFKPRFKSLTCFCGTWRKAD